jgi:acyl-CoA synthetase (AMP-forming)/AMP-acid ligase II
MTTILDVLDRRACEETDRMALTYLSHGETITGTLTYGELQAKAMQVASVVSRRCKIGDRALLLYPPGLEFAIAFLGCLYAGIIAVPAYSPRSRKRDIRVAAIQQDAMPAVALTVGGLIDRLEIDKIPVLATDHLSNDFSDFVCRKRSGLAWLQYTSGSTASPRGVMVAHENFVQNSACLQQAAQYSSETISVTWLPHFHDMGLVEGLLQPIFHGFPVYLFPAPIFLQRPLTWLALMSRYRATHSGAPNFAYELCVRAARTQDLDGLNLTSWSTAYVGAEPVYRDTLESFYDRFRLCGFRWEALYPAYGMAETTLEISGRPKGRGPRFVQVSKHALSEHRVEVAVETTNDATSLVSCGSPLQDFTLLIVDTINGTVCPEGQVGEIWVDGKSVAQGYWRQDAETQSIFGSYTATGDGPYLRTGDLGCLLDGELFVTGRLKDLIILRGRNYYPADIERIVATCFPEITTCAAFQCNTTDGGRLVLVLEADRHLWRDLRGKTVTTTDFELMVRKIQRELGDALELSCDQVMIVTPGSIPKTSSGKVQRHLCRKWHVDGRFDPLWRWQRPSMDVVGFLGVSL